MLNPNRYVATMAMIGGVALGVQACGNSTAGADACAAAGAKCIAVGDCGVGIGFIGTQDCGAEDNLCCYPLTACTNASQGTAFEENFGLCCGSTTTYRPVFDGAKLICSSGNPQSVCTQTNSSDPVNGERQCPSGSVQLPTIACQLNLSAADSCQ